MEGKSNSISDTHKQITFMRHGSVEVNYNELDYATFMGLMLHKIDLDLDKESNQINLHNIPTDIDVIYHSATKRSLQTAQFIKKHLLTEAVISDRCAPELAEVKFDDEIITEDQYNRNEGLVGCREIVLKKWYAGKNNVETFANSWERAGDLYRFLNDQPKEKILLVTHGWYLRLLKFYFKNCNPLSHYTSMSEDALLQAKPPMYGECFQFSLKKYDTPHTEPQLVVEAEPQLVVEAEPQLVVEAEPQLVVEAEPQLVVEAEPQLVVEAEPQLVVEAEPQLVVEAEPQLVVEAEPQLVLEAEPQLVLEAEPQLVVEAEPIVQ